MGKWINHADHVLTIHYKSFRCYLKASPRCCCCCERVAQLMCSCSCDARLACVAPPQYWNYSIRCVALLTFLAALELCSSSYELDCQEWSKWFGTTSLWHGCVYRKNLATLWETPPYQTALSPGSAVACDVTPYIPRLRNRVYCWDFGWFY